MQAQDNVLFSGKIQEYEAAFNLVDTEMKGEVPSRRTVGEQAMQAYSYCASRPTSQMLYQLCTLQSCCAPSVHVCTPSGLAAVKVGDMFCKRCKHACPACLSDSSLSSFVYGCDILCSPLCWCMLLLIHHLCMGLQTA